jgi:hypothetical protein
LSVRTLNGCCDELSYQKPVSKAELDKIHPKYLANLMPENRVSRNDEKCKSVPLSTPQLSAVLGRIIFFDLTDFDKVVCQSRWCRADPFRGFCQCRNGFESRPLRSLPYFRLWSRSRAIAVALFDRPFGALRSTGF